MSPAPFLRSLVWPFSYSELHFFTSLYTAFWGGLLMLAITRGTKYDMNNPWRLGWAFTSRAQLRVVIILVKLLRPRTPWPVVISQCLPMEGPANVMYSVALMGPVRQQAVGAMVDVLHVIIVSRMYGSNWPYSMSPRLVILLQAACGLVVVGISAFTNTGPVAGKAPPGAPRSPKDGLKVTPYPAGGLAAGATEAEAGGWVRAEAVGAAAAPASAPKKRSAPVNAGVEAEAEVEGAASGSPAGVPPGACCSRVRTQQLMSLCCRLARGEGTAAAAAATGCDTATRLQRPGGAGYGVHGGSSCRRGSSSSECGSKGGSSNGTPPWANGSADGTISTSSSEGGGHSGGCRGYDRLLIWTHVRMKLHGLEPAELAPGLQVRVAGAVAGSCPGVAGTDIAVRSGCVEVHLDLVRSVPLQTVLPAAAAAAVATANVAAEDGSGIGAAAAAAAAGQRAPPAPPRVATGTGVSPLAPASAEQQGLASCILAALGLPPDYGSAVRAQVGSHLLTLTPAASPGDGWAVLGTRRLQAHEVPRVTHVQPPALMVSATAPACAVDGSAAVTAQETAVLRLTVSGSVERLAAAQEDRNLELLALFDGAFLRLSNLQWGPLEAGCNGAAAATSTVAFQLPPSLALCQRVLTASVELPVGRTGASSLLLIWRGTAGQSHPLLLLRPEDGAMGAEVAALQARAWNSAPEPVSEGPSASSVAGFIRDLGHWLQYRDFWRRRVAANLLTAPAAAAAAAGGRGRGARPGRLAGRLAVSWMRLLLAWDGSGRGLGFQLQPKMSACSSGQPAPPQWRLGNGHQPGALSAAAARVREQEREEEREQVLRSGGSDLLDQGSVHAGTTFPGNSSRSPARAAGGELREQALHRAPLSEQTGGHMLHDDLGAAAVSALPSPSIAQQQQQWLAQSSAPAYGQRAYLGHMQAARRVLLEFALEQRCPAVAAALLEPAPLPPSAAGADAAVTAYGAASYLAELAESSRASSPDGLTLLHRAVRSGDPATVEVLLAAGARAAAAATTAAAASAAGAEAQQAQPVPRRLANCGGGGGSGGAAADPQRQQQLALFRWDAPDVHGITPLHYAAVLADGGALARHVLRTCPEALALWEEGGPDMPSPASFAAQNGTAVDAEALRREQQRSKEQLQPEGAGGASSGGASDGAGTEAHGIRPLFLAALWGFPCGELERRYQHFAGSRAAGGALPPAWLLLLLHLMACAGGLLQALAQPHARCRRGALQLAALQGGCFLLALCGHRPVGPGRGRVACRLAAWVLQAVVLALLLAKTVDPLHSQWPLDCGDRATYVCKAGDGGGAAASGDGAAAAASDCSRIASGDTLLVLNHVIAVATMPYMVPYALYKVLVVVAMEALACVLLLVCTALRCIGFGATPAAGRLLVTALAGGAAAATGEDGSGTCGSDVTNAAGEGVYSGGPLAQGLWSRDAGLALSWAGGAAACMAGGTLLRSAVSCALVLAADLRTRAAFVSAQVDGCAPLEHQQPLRQKVHAKVD